MRIIYDHQVTSLQNVGGISLYFYELIRNLMQTPDEIKLGAEVFLGRNQSAYLFPSLDSHKCHIHSLATALRPGYGRYCINEIMTSGAAFLSGRYDIYHPTLHRCMPAIRARNIVITHHDCIQERFPELFNATNYRRQVRLKQFNRAALILCNSEFSRRDLLEYYPIAPEKTRVIHHGVIHLAEGKLPAEVSPLGPYILYVGGRSHYKNFPMLLHAFATSRVRREFNLVCAGGGTFNAEELNAICAERVEGRVISVPRVAEGELGALYRGAHLLVYPSLSEGFGLPPLEAMRCQTISAVSRAGAIPEICQDGAVYFDPYSSESIAEALERAAYDSSLREAVRDRGQTVVDKYSWSTCALRTLDAYRELV